MADGTENNASLAQTKQKTLGMVRSEKRSFLSVVDLNARPGTPTVLGRAPDARREGALKLPDGADETVKPLTRQSSSLSRRRPLTLASVAEFDEDAILRSPPTLVSQALKQPYTHVVSDGRGTEMLTPGLADHAQAEQEKSTSLFTPRQASATDLSFFASRSPFQWATPSPPPMRVETSFTTTAFSPETGFMETHKRMMANVFAELQSLALEKTEDQATTPVNFEVSYERLHRRTFEKAMSELRLLARLVNEEHWDESSSLLDHATVNMSRMLIEEVLDDELVESPIKIVNESMIDDSLTTFGDRITLNSSSTDATPGSDRNQSHSEPSDGAGRTSILDDDLESDLTINKTSSTVLANRQAGSHEQSILDVDSEKESVLGAPEPSGQSSLLDLSSLSLSVSRELFGDETLDLSPPGASKVGLSTRKDALDSGKVYRDLTSAELTGLDDSAVDGAFYSTVTDGPFTLWDNTDDTFSI